ncbi:hypothetical protein [Erythrobacter litoralis]|uniref:Putative inner membrane protein n=1 Tax=Erythrobacter litoralis (strain HTCC2594) TaxID=314225 RepID=Q2NBU4_ERYLH|nr:hypothetical protein [Erythrobacter litoralis]ABC62847.1 putative inner membrane protein [Erythrobacter litoralis HTCC2594]
MAELLKQLSNREIATLIWIGLFLIWMLATPKVRQSLGAVIKAFCQPVILRVVAVAALYIMGTIWLLYWRDIWTTDFIYMTLTWAITFGLVTMFEAHKMASDKRFMGKIIRDVFNVTAVLIFFIELHSFSLVVELIALPVVTLLTLMHELAKMKEEHAAVEKLLGAILAIVGLSYLSLSLWQTWAGYGEINGLDTLRAFIIPILLSLLFLPFLFGLGVYMAYERIFASLSLWMDKKLLKYSKRQAGIRCRTNLDYLERWHRVVQRERPETKEAARKLFEDVEAVLKREKSPPEVEPKDGWSPWSAKDFMRTFELETRDYHQRYEGNWFAETELKPIGSGFPRNNVAYYIEGEANCAKQLRLKLNVNAPDDDGEARALFAQAALYLLLKASQSAPTKRIERKIEALEDFEIASTTHTISLEKDDWSRGTRPEYDLVFKIKIVSY